MFSGKVFMVLTFIVGALLAGRTGFPSAVKEIVSFVNSPQAQLVAALEGLPLEPFSDTYVARPDLEAQLRSYMNKGKQPGYLVVVGPLGSGKSTLIRHFFSVGYRSEEQNSKGAVVRVMCVLPFRGTLPLFNDPPPPSPPPEPDKRSVAAHNACRGRVHALDQAAACALVWR